MLSEWGAGVTEDPRLELHYTDAHAFLKENEGLFDVIIMDIADPIEAGPGYVLYTQVRGCFRSFDCREGVANSPLTPSQAALPQGISPRYSWRSVAVIRFLP